MRLSLEAQVNGSPARSAILRATGLEKRYFAANGADSLVVHGLDLSIEEGEFVSIVGPSGCGKTTLLKMLAGIVPSTAGHVEFRDTGRDPGPRDFGMVFQQAALLPWRTNIANVLLPADILRLPKSEARSRAEELLQLMQLPRHVEQKYPGELSGGMQQRVAIARALLHDPALIMMDEPFGALDAMTRESLNMHLQDIHQAQRKTVVFVTHSISEAVLLSDRVVVMHANPGRIEEIVKIDMPRPRRIVDMATPEFRSAEFEIRGVLDRKSN